MFVSVARGFTNQDLRQAYAVLLGLHAGDVTPGRMTYERRRLRLHGLIERVPNTHRYHLRNLGLQKALFYARVYSRILRPGLALDRPQAPAASPASLQRSFPHRRTRRQCLVRRSENCRVKKLDSIAAKAIQSGNLAFSIAHSERLGIVLRYSVRALCRPRRRSEVT